MELRETLRRNAAPLVVVLTAVVAVVLANSYHEGGSGDFPHMLYPTEALATGRFGELYPPLTRASSLTGWLLLVIVPYLNLKVLLGTSAAFMLAGMVAVPLLVGGVRYAATALHPTMPTSRAWFLAGVSLLLPTTWAAWFEYYHPQDIAATGLALFGLGLAAKKRWLAAGLLLGFAVLTRHWALLIVLVAATLARSKSWQLLGTAAAVVVAGVVPVVLAGNEGLVSGVTAATAFVTDRTLVGRFVSDTGLASEVYRALPVVATLALCAFVWLRGLSGRVWLAPLAASVILLRVLFDIAPYTYYWAPALVFLLVVSARPRVWLAAVGLSVAVWPVQYFWGGETTSLAVAWYTAVAAVAGLVLTWVVALRWGGTDDADGDAIEDVATESAAKSAEGSADGEAAGLPWGTWLVAGVLSVAALGVGFTAAVRQIAADPNSSEVELPGTKEIFFSEAVVEDAPDLSLPLVGQRAPSVTGKNPSGITTTVGPVEDQTTVLAFWVHWCEQCQDDLPEVVAWVGENDVAGGAVVGPVDAERLTIPQRFWLIGAGWNYPTVVDWLNSDVRRAFGFSDYPAYVVVDPQGVIVDAWQGAWDPARAAAHLS